MNTTAISLALEAIGGSRADDRTRSEKREQKARRFLQTVATMSRAEADFLDTIIGDADSPEGAWQHVPGPNVLSIPQIKAVWNGVNEQARRILCEFLWRGGDVSPQEIMDAIGVDEPRLLNGPLGGISRRVKKLLGDPEATFYSIHPESGRYVLPTDTFNALSDFVELNHPELLRGETSIAENSNDPNGGNHD
jgi:hypothetical protein